MNFKLLQLRLRKKVKAIIILNKISSIYKDKMTIQKKKYNRHNSSFQMKDQLMIMNNELYWKRLINWNSRLIFIKKCQWKKILS